MTPGSGRSVVLVDGAAEDSSSSDRRVQWDDDDGVVLGWMLSQTLVRTVPVEVADMILYLSSSASDLVCGQDILIDGGYTAL